MIDNKPRFHRHFTSRLGTSRDDSSSFLAPYQEAESFKKNPFAGVDQTGVGQVMQQIAIEKRGAPGGVAGGVK